MSIQDDLVKSVASKINFYIDVKQREDGFNLSGSSLRYRKPLYIPVPPQRPRLNGSSSIKRSRFSIYNTLQEPSNILGRRRQRNQNLSPCIPVVLGHTKRDKIVQTASKFLVSLGYYNTSPLWQHGKNQTENKIPNKLPNIKERKNYQDFIYDDIGSVCKEEIDFDYGKKSPDFPTSIPVNSNQPHSESLNSSSTPREHVKPSYLVSYSADSVSESYGVLINCATQTNSENDFIPRNPLTNHDQEYAEIKSGKESTYIVVVKTGNVLGASTRAQVKIVLCGSEGKTGALTLLKSETNKIRFQKGKEDHFILKTFHVGHLEKIRIGHDRPELPYAWFLESVSIFDQTEKWIYVFPSGQWFSGEDGDKQTYRELLLQRNMPMVGDIEDVNEEDLLLWLAKTNNHENGKDTDVHKEMTADNIKNEIHLNEDDETLDTSISDASSLSSDGSSNSLVNRFHQGTVISVQNQVTTGTQTNTIPGKPYNLARDFHQSGNDGCTSEVTQSVFDESGDKSVSLKKEGVKSKDQQKEEAEENVLNRTFSEKKKENTDQSSSDGESFY